MASSIALAPPQPLPLLKRALGLIPGLLLLVAVGYAGKFIERSIALYGKAHHLTLPNIEYVLWAILIGLVISNIVGVPEIFRAGIATYEFWLKAGIVLLGARFLLGDVLKLGGVSLVLVAIEIVVSLVFMTYLGRGFGLKTKTHDAARRRLLDLRSFCNHCHTRRDRRGRRRFLVCHRRHSDARRHLAFHFSARRPLAAPQRFELWPVGWPWHR